MQRINQFSHLTGVRLGWRWALSWAVAGLPAQRALRPGCRTVRCHRCHRLDCHRTEPLVVCVAARESVDHDWLARGNVRPAPCAGLDKVWEEISRISMVILFNTAQYIGEQIWHKKKVTLKDALALDCQLQTQATHLPIFAATCLRELPTQAGSPERTSSWNREQSPCSCDAHERAV